ncbi:3'-5' exonuclease [Photobacterium iliopiscarium]|uniref:3'-5' exonuclease n=1 Tax=Photobacterium iliopiscarium TaxID=56192 RepID=UPI001E47F1C3|nr:3'-5' exonuclease [Photobacterium iliopiscarium]MCD9465627.1 DNA helicase II [Photobacterium iliopiscarium]MCD9485570.1 AAA family ATPase [Photobacterium iliopiscarium]MCF2242267.1 AAA family ATPase [Photobacterium iliopiscarium]
MAILIPALTTCLKKMTLGEKRFARRLESHLEDDYLCWFDIPVGKKRRYPDFIILHPDRGLLFLEVKDWRLSSISDLTSTQVTLHTDKGLERKANPLEQVRQCTYTVLNKLKYDLQLINHEGKYKGSLVFPYGYGVVLTNITRKQLDDAIPLDAQDTVLQPHLVICKDEMTESVDIEVFQSQLWGMFNYTFPNKLTLPQIDRIRWHLYPEIRIQSSDQVLLFDEDDFEFEHENFSGNMPDIIKIMDIQQEQLARSLGEGHRVIHGVAGSGKTLILGYRCLHLAALLHKPILVLCFNITLASKLRSFIRDKEIEHKVQVYHFHDWCGQQLRTYHIKLVGGDNAVWERQVDSVIAGVDKGDIPRAQYGAVLIDEGHDFEADWLKLITQMVDPDTNSLLLLYDDAQSIYKHKNGLNFSLSSVGIQAQGRTTILKLNYRNTQEILKFSYQFAQTYFEQADHDDIPVIKPEAAGISGDKPIVRQFSDAESEVHFLVRCINKWLEDGQFLQNIAILYPSSYMGKKAFDALKKAGIDCIWLAKSDYKKKYDPKKNQLAILPIHSSKGLEFDTVVILDSSHQSQDEEDISSIVRLLYVGFTRAMKHLLITYHKENELSKSFEKIATRLWD